jgi:hypothetical protein
MADTSISPFAYFPPELVFHIFSIAAAVSRHSCLALCRVSSWARHIALPHLLHTVVIKNHLSNSQFHRCLREPTYKPGDLAFRAAPFVRNVWMEAMSDGVLSVFSACDNIEHLAVTDGAFLWLIHASSPLAMVDLFSGKILQNAFTRDRDLHLTMINPARNWPHPNYPHDATKRSQLFSKITHIRLANLSLSQTHWENDMSLFTRLSHLAIPLYDWLLNGSGLQHLLQLLSLDMLVAVIMQDLADRAPAKESLTAIRKVDSRLYFVESHCQGVDIQSEWEVEMRGGESIWERAIRYTRAWDERNLPGGL